MISKGVINSALQVQKPARIVSQSEIDQLKSDPRFTPAHEMIMQKKIDSGEWEIRN